MIFPTNAKSLLCTKTIPFVQFPGGQLGDPDITTDVYTIGKNTEDILHSTINKIECQFSTFLSPVEINFLLFCHQLKSIFYFFVTS